MTAPRRPAAIRAACHAANLPEYASDIRATRGKCRKRRCPSRWGITRVSLDFRTDTVDRLATIECASCGRTWRRVSVPAIASVRGYQAVRLTLILPASAHRWYARGRWHREGDDGIVVREATLGDLDDAARTHRERSDRKADTRARAATKRAAELTTDNLRTADLLARLATLDAERAADDARAEAAYG